jgi:phosphatidylserine/phosphatidylglycerophosphate/cardiolipin synthase-like enzyme
VARELADFLGETGHSLDLALYDFDLRSPGCERVAEAIVDAKRRGAEVRLAFNVDHEKPAPLFPPPQGDPSLIDSLDVPTKAIPGVPDLMHHKYAVRDGDAVWTGSANWTDDSWTRQENVIAVIQSPALASAYTRDFEQLWGTGIVAESGFVDPNPVRVDGRRVRAWFSPGRGEALATRLAQRVTKANERIRICSPVLTSGPILGALAERVSEGDVDIAGVIDATQMQGVFHQWRLNGNADWKLPIVARIFGAAPFAGKLSTPYGQGGVHDYMHAKLTVTDDMVFTGSYNLSRSGEQNAENVLEVRDAELADKLAAWIDEVRARYPAAPLPSVPG